MHSLSIKPVSSLTEKDFIEHQVWACYYEPDDVEALVDLGYDRQEIERMLQSTGYSNEFAFPLPPEAAHVPFNYLYHSIQAVTKGGNKLIGYITGPCVAVYFHGRWHLFNSNVRDLSLAAAQKLATALGERSAFPMQIEVVATAQRMEVNF